MQEASSQRKSARLTSRVDLVDFDKSASMLSPSPTLAPSGLPAPQGQGVPPSWYNHTPQWAILSAITHTQAHGGDRRSAHLVAHHEALCPSWLS
jgi:hypothetical protein